MMLEIAPALASSSTAEHRARARDVGAPRPASRLRWGGAVGG